MVGNRSRGTRILLERVPLLLASTPGLCALEIATSLA